MDCCNGARLSFELAKLLFLFPKTEFVVDYYLFCFDMRTGPGLFGLIGYLELDIIF